MSIRFIAMAVVLLALSACHNTGNNQYAVAQIKKSSTEPLRGMHAADTLNEALTSEEYADIPENEFISPAEEPLSTFSIDVDDASYSNMRRFLNNGSLPPTGAVRIEEFINYFDYDYAPPAGEEPFAVHTEIASCPWNENNKLVHIALKGKEISVDRLPPANLVFLVDVSGSMGVPEKLPLVKESLLLLTEQLRETDRVSIVVYAGEAGLVLPSTPGSDKSRIRKAISQLESGGSTAGGEGIILAYKVAEANRIAGGNNRVILATDGDFNVGVSNDEELVKLIEAERNKGIFLSVLGYGMGNYKDKKMQELADNGNGNHSYIDNIKEAQKVLISEFGSTLFAIAKDVKIQVEFNPEKVHSYRLIGYENRMLETADFENDARDAGELGIGHTVTALYEIVPADTDAMITGVPAIRKKLQKGGMEGNGMFEVELRYKDPEGEKSVLMKRVAAGEERPWVHSSENFRFAAAVAEFGLLLRKSKFAHTASFDQVSAIAKNALGKDRQGYRQEFLDLVKKAAALSGSR